MYRIWIWITVPVLSRIQQNCTWFPIVFFNSIEMAWNDPSYTASVWNDLAKHAVWLFLLLCVRKMPSRWCKMWAKPSLRFYIFFSNFIWTEEKTNEKNVSNHLNPCLAFQDFNIFFKVWQFLNHQVTQLKALHALHQKSTRYGMQFM